MENTKVKEKNLSPKIAATTGVVKTSIAKTDNSNDTKNSVAKIGNPKETNTKLPTADVQPVTVVAKRKITQKLIPITTPSAEIYTKKIERRRKRKSILLWVFGVFAVLFIIFGFVAPYVFTDKNHWTYEYFVTNTVNVRNIGQFFRDKLPLILQSIIIIIAFTIVINLVIFSIMKMSIRNKRTKTVAGMVGSFVRYIGYFIMILTLLRVWGVNTTAILSATAIFSMVIALGAQSLVSDILAGIFMVFENNFSVGDIITVEGNNGNFRGYVENIGIRTTQIRAELGEVMIIANSQMKKIVNQSMHRCGIICAVTVDHDANTDKIEKIVNENIIKMGEKIPEITEGPSYLGVSDITGNGVVLKFFAKCDESMRYKATRALTQEIKKLFNKNNIKFAVDKIEVHKEK
ncbi:MAG: mechanosensitive ion channel family protein [Christensenellaceae bacterium]|jgi:small conductance mechanosensitive channel|nr:mechanosensitive ion channel family protein [Christensenellaceae bacterium]